MATQVPAAPNQSNLFGDAYDFPGVPADVVGIATAPVGVGYWLVKGDGAVFAYDDGQNKVLYHGGANVNGAGQPVRLNKPVVGMAARPVSAASASTGGYWLAAADGGVFAYGGAPFLGSAGNVNLNKPVVGIAAHTRSDLAPGYWLVAADGGIFSYGNAPFHGSAANAGLNYPYDMVVGMAARPDGDGYWLVSRRGRVFNYGAAGHYGDASGLGLDDDHDIVGIAARPNGLGYWLLGRDGGAFAYGDAEFHGAATARRWEPGAPGTAALEPLVGIAATGPGGYRLAEAKEGAVHAFGPMSFSGGGGGFIAQGTGSGGTVTSPNDPPVGYTDESSVARVRGWAYDPNEPTRSIEVHVYIDGVGYNLGPTTEYRGDVNAAHNITGYHGFEWTPPSQWSDGNPHTIEVYAIDSTGGTNTRLSVTSSSGTNYPPAGELDWAGPYGVHGYAYDDNDPYASIRIQVTIDTTVYVLGPTSLWDDRRPFGDHGFDWIPPVEWRDGRLHTIEVRALDTAGGPSTLLGSRRFRALADDWTDGDGALWDATKWITSRNSSTKVVNVQGNQGRLYVKSSSARATATMAAVANSDATFTYRFDNRDASSYLRVMLRASGASGADQMPNGYRVELRSDSNTIKLQRYVNGTATQIGSFSYTKDINAQKLRFQVSGNTIRVKAWAAGSSEPSTWQIQVTDTSITGSGVFQVNHNWSSGTRSVYLDDLVLTDLNP